MPRLFAQRCPSCPWTGVSAARRGAAALFFGGVVAVLAYVYLGAADVVPAQPIPAIGLALLTIWGGVSWLLRRERCPACGARGLRDDGTG